MKRLSVLLGGLLVSTALGHAQPLPPVPHVSAPAFTSGSSWKPTDSSGASLTFTNVASNFVVIGNFVFAYSNFTYPSTADGSNAQIGGLPLVTAGNIDYAAICNVSFLIAPISFIQVGNTLYFYQGATASKSGANINLNTGGRIPFTNASLSGVPVAVTCIYPAS
jgi:hypothetical protein